MNNEKLNVDATDNKKSIVDPTDPRQAAFVSGGITGAVAGAALGSVGGPVGTVIGAAAGGLAGAKTAEHISIDTAAEETYWRKNWRKRAYAANAKNFSEYDAAFRVGYSLPDDIYSNQGANFESSEERLKSNYEASGSTMPWENARPAVKDAFERVISKRK